MTHGKNLKTRELLYKQAINEEKIDQQNKTIAKGIKQNKNVQDHNINL